MALVTILGVGFGVNACVKILSASAELMSQQPSPFANLESLKIYPKRFGIGLKEKVDIPAEVKNYLLDGSQSATFTIISREEIMAEKNSISAKNCIANLWLLLEKEKADIETRKDHTEQENAPESYNEKMHEQPNANAENQVQITENILHFNSYWDRWKEQIKQRKKKINHIIAKLQEIRKLLTKLPALTRAEMHPCFTSLCAEAAIIMSKITHSIEAQFDENQRCLDVSFHELAVSLQSFP